MTSSDRPGENAQPDRLKKAYEQLNSNGPAVPVSEPLPSEPEKSKKLTEIDGPEGPDPTRFGDWERNGRCIDF